MLRSRARVAVVAALAIDLLACASAAQNAPARPRRTPPQKLFDWTELQFPVLEYQARRAAIIARLRESGGGVLLVPSAEGTSDGTTFRQLDDFWYFTGLELPRSMLVIDADAKSVILFAPGNDRRFFNPARRNDFPGRRLGADPDLAERSGIGDLRAYSEFEHALTEWADDGRTVRVNAGRGGEAKAPELAPIARVGPAQWLLLYLRTARPKLVVRNAFADVARLRMVKSSSEIDVLRRACGITVAGIRTAAGTIRDGVDERALEGVLERTFKQLGAQRLPFSSIIKSGPNSLWPWRILAAHYDRRNRAMRDGELVIFDVGCELDQYATDVGRTFPVSGEFTARQREILLMETAVADAVIAAVKPGTTLGELQKIANATIPKAHRRCMQTGLFFGHHIGLATGDPTLAGAPLEPGMVFTVEPWYYNHGEGIAVFTEDMILVTANGAENLTAALPRTPDELEKLVGKK